MKLQICKLSNLHRISEKRAEQFGMRGYIWHIEYNDPKRYDQLNIRDKTLIGLIYKVIRFMIFRNHRKLLP